MNEAEFTAPIPAMPSNDPFPETYPSANPRWLEHVAAQERKRAVAQDYAVDEPARQRNNRLDRLAILRGGGRGPLRITPLEDVFGSEDTEKAHFIKGVIAWNETSAWIAPPGGMKSALLASASISIALGKDWFGRKNKCAAGVVYFALERADLVKRRLMAHRDQLGLASDQPIPIVIVSGMIDGMNPATVPLIVQTVRRAEEYFASFESGVHMAGVLIFDTFAKMIAAGGGDENSAKDQGKVFANLQRIKDELEGPHIALIGHTGKDESRGARGSNAIYGDVDMMVEIGGGDIKTATVTKANDAPEGPLFSFKSEIVNFGTDEDGDPITVNIVGSEGVEARVAAKPEKRLSETQEAMYRLLRDAGPAGLSTDDWNEKAREIGIGVKRRATLHNVRSQLCDKGLAREYAGIWRANNG